MELTTFFAHIADPRRGQGQRHPLQALLWITFLAIAAGQRGPRKIAAFGRSNVAFLTTYFDLRHGMPSYGPFREVLNALDQHALAQHFTRTFLDGLQAGDWVAGDGQSLNATLQDPHGAGHTLAAVVSLYCQRTGLTHALASYTDKKSGELTVLRDLLPSLQQRGVVLTLDALHCQKKQPPLS